jgi:hypothetical protein
MNVATTAESPGLTGELPTRESPVSAVSWAAVFCGAMVAVAITLVLLTLGSGFGLASASVWNPTASAVGIGVTTGIWLIVVQWAASGLGGYLTGRLRTRWVGTHSHEVFFRDTAHGFLTWSLATVIVAAFAAASASVTVKAASDASQPAATAGLAYDADAIFRSPTSDATALVGAKAEAIRILAASALRGGMTPADQAYLAASAAARTGVSPVEAEGRVQAALSREKAAADQALAAADKARKAASAFAILTALSMFVGAFIACVAAALGGQQRDEHP